jgi:hypothetical protein
LTEVEDALDLFWRVNVDPSLINLGIAFYGRSFTLENPLCIFPGCAFVLGDAAGGDPGPCTNTRGILSYKEINDVISDENDSASVKWYQDEGVKVLVYGSKKNNCESITHLRAISLRAIPASSPTDLGAACAQGSRTTTRPPFSRRWTLAMPGGLVA